MLVTGLGGRTAKLAIYNRWGNKVFTGEGGSLSWDGKANTGLSFGQWRTSSGHLLLYV